MNSIPLENIKKIKEQKATTRIPIIERIYKVVKKEIPKASLKKEYFSLLHEIFHHINTSFNEIIR
ncbi:hypothetical protein COE58_24425 [Bacillus cereus]|nr:hypothetical protein COE58_24425 [Bacillus cereus]